MAKKGDFRTLCVHAGELKDTQYGGAISPLYASTSYTFTDVKVDSILGISTHLISVDFVKR